jgi:glycerophosphoryl diester phosphodiesterase
MLVLAHRGVTDRFPENSVAAFAEARRIGVDGVELDVRRSADGALVVHHDPEVPGVGPVKDLRVRDLPPGVPLLEEALDACQGMVVNVEIKSDGDEALPRAVAAALADLGWGRQVVVSSFDRGCIDTVRLADPGLPVAWLLGWGSEPRRSLQEAVHAGYEGVHPFHRSVDSTLVRDASSAGLAVRPWTVNEPTDLRAMADYGVDAVITDRPTDAIALARGR